MQDRLSRWWATISLRTKITSVTVLLLTLGLAVAGSGTLSVVSSYLINDVDNELKAAAQKLDPVLDLDGKDTFSEDAASGLIPYYLAAVAADGTLIKDNLNRDEQGIAPDVSELSLLYLATHYDAFTITNEAHTVSWRLIALPQRVVTSEGDQATLLVGRNLSRNNALLNQYSAIFVFFALTVIVFGGALTRLLVTSTFTPLREVEATAARFAAGDFSQRLGGATPNTEVGRLNRSLNAMLNRIDRAFADRAKTIEQMRRFVGDASHELRTPLVSVRGYAELYRMGALRSTDEVAQAMERIEKEAIRMGELVGDLLELARIDEAKPLQLTAVDLVPLARDAALDAMASSPERDVRVVTIEPRQPLPPISIDTDTTVITLPPAGPPATPARGSSLATGPIAFAGATLARLRLRRARPAKPTDAVTVELHEKNVSAHVIVAAEENKLRQVLTNLMGNALRFTPKDSPIEIALEADTERNLALVSVVDHGEGIPPQIREKIFQRFWRADSSRNRDTGGSGLGLAIAASIVAAHKGEIRVLETPGGGATFQVSLPLLHPGQDPTLLTAADH
jgi:two-component system, OmpR family, sensor kinase